MSTTPPLEWLLVFGLFAAIGAAQQAPQSPRYPISGTVVDHVSNRLVPRALVRLSPVDGPGQLTSLTGEDGRFEFSNIPKGKYRLSAQRRSHFPQSFHETGQYSTAIVVGSGQDATGIVFPLRSLGSISCLVLDEEGSPVQQASVTIFREMVNEGEKQTIQIGNGMTNSLGEFRNGQLAAGTYYVLVQSTASTAAIIPRAPGSDSANTEPDIVYPLTYYGNTSDSQAATPITLTEGAATQVQVNLHPVPGIHVPVPLVQPNNGFSSQLQVLGPGGVRVNVGNSVSGTPDGGLEITGIPAGHYFANVSSAHNGQWSQSPLREVDLVDGVPLHTPERAPTIRFTGHVTFDGGKAPATPLQLMAVDRTEQFAVPAQIGPDGALAVSQAFSPGIYTLHLNSTDYYLKSLEAKGARVTGDHVELPEGASVNLSLVIGPIESLSKLDGFAQRDGKPVPGAMVLLVPSDLNRTTLFRRDQSDSDGSFTMPAILPGRYTLIGIDDNGRGLVYKDPVVIQRYLAAGRSITFPYHSTEPVKVPVRPRLQ